MFTVKIEYTDGFSKEFVIEQSDRYDATETLEEHQRRLEKLVMRALSAAKGALQ